MILLSEEQTIALRDLLAAVKAHGELQDKVGPLSHLSFVVYEPVPAGQPETPELDKLSKLAPKNDIVSAFLQWLDEEEIELAQYEVDELVPVSVSRENLLGRYLGIDPRTLEKERSALLAYARKDFKA